MAQDRIQDRLKRNPPAVAVQLYYVLSGVRPWRPHEQKEDLVYHGATRRVRDVAVVDAVARKL
jgi:hypothetical protein